MVTKVVPKEMWLMLSLQQKVPRDVLATKLYPALNLNLGLHETLALLTSQLTPDSNHKEEMGFLRDVFSEKSLSYLMKVKVHLWTYIFLTSYLFSVPLIYQLFTLPKLFCLVTVLCWAEHGFICAQTWRTFKHLLIFNIFCLEKACLPECTYSSP